MLTMNPYDLATEPLLKELLILETREPWRDWAGTTLAHLRSKYRDGKSSEIKASNQPFIISDEPAMIRENSILRPEEGELLLTPGQQSAPCQQSTTDVRRTIAPPHEVVWHFSPRRI